MKERSFSEWMDWLQGRADPCRIKLGLERLHPIVKRLGLQQFDCPVITVTGTNGKGSTLAFLETYLSHQGYRVGLYTSPHFHSYTERVRVGQKSVSKDDFCLAFKVIEAACNQEPLTYFEIGTLVALYLFKQVPLDFIFLEVGLGGRLDAVNCIDANLAVMTNVALDHTEFLGETLEAIAIEKSGIIKPTTEAVVLGDAHIPAIAHQRATQFNIPVFQAEQQFGFKKYLHHWAWWGEGQHFDQLPYGALPVENIATAIQLLYCLPQVEITEQCLKSSIQSASLAGRFQTISKRPKIILDVAHNPAACQWLAKRLRENPISGKTLAVFSALNDKDVYHMTQALEEEVDQWVLVGLSGQRGQTIETLSQFVSPDTAKVVLKSKVSDGIDYALSHATEYDRILVTGSFYMAAEAMIVLKCHKELEIGSI